jgi:hypothetical protein
MPRLDAYHHCVRNALVKDGWTITHDPLTLPFGGDDVYIDLGAEFPIGAERDGLKIAVEVKSFLGASNVTALQQALGQYRLYRFVLTREEPDRLCYLAMPNDAYESLFQYADVLALIPSEDLRLLVFDPTEEVIVQWIME